MLDVSNATEGERNAIECLLSVSGHPTTIYLAPTDQGISTEHLFDISSDLDVNLRISVAYYVTVICGRYEFDMPDIYIDCPKKPDSDGVYVRDLIEAIAKCNYKPPKERNTLVSFDAMNQVYLVAIFKPNATLTLEAHRNTKDPYVKQPS
jgi:hypothetical protein